MVITDINVIIDVVTDVFEYLNNVDTMRPIPDADITKLFDDDTTATR